MRQPTGPAQRDTPREQGHFIGQDHEGNDVHSRPRKHLLVAGPSQTGKTDSVLAHAVLDTAGATVTTSTKEDLLRLPSRPGARVLNLLDAPVPPDGVEYFRFSPLTLVHTFEDALRTGRTLMDSAYSFAGSGVTNESYWTQRGARVVAALLWAAHRGRRPIGTVFQWAAQEDARGPLACLHESPDDLTARDILTGLTVPDGKGGSKPSSQASAVWSFATQSVALYAYPRAAALAASPNLDPDDFVRGTATLHIVCPSTMAAELGPVIAVLLQALIDARYRAHARALHEGTQSATRLTFVLDEVANTAPLPTLPALCSEGAGQGVSLIIGTQDRAQLEDRFGDQQARTIVSNCRDRVITAELGDRPFLEDIEALSGTIWRPDFTTGSGDSGTTRNESHSERPQWRAWEIAQLRDFTALYLTGWKPRLVDLILWQERRRT